MKLQQLFSSRRAWLVVCLVVMGLAFSTHNALARVVGPDIGDSGTDISVVDQQARDNEAYDSGEPNNGGQVFKSTTSTVTTLYCLVAGANCDTTTSTSGSAASTTPDPNNPFNDPIPPRTLQDAGTQQRNRGAIGDLAMLSAAFYRNPPASTELYIADVLNSAGFAFAQPAYAQGLGFSSLSPVLEAWKTLRNLAYFFFVLIFLAIGMLITLRHKIGGQTVITAQQAIPRVVIALLAVTFSYAIAGVLIDGMYIFMFLLIGIFGASPEYVNMNFIELGKTLVVSGAMNVVDPVTEFVDTLMINIPGGLEQILSKTFGITAAVIIAIAILFGIFKLFLELLRTYMYILISIILAPILLMMGAIPGKNVFGNWVKSLIGNLAAFPTTLLVLLMYDQLTGGLSGDVPDAIGKGGFLPPYLIGGGSGNMLVFLIGFGMIMIIGDIVKQAKNALGAGKGPFDVFAQSMADAVKKGWEGGQLVPGLGFTDTKKLGLTGKNITQQGLVQGSGIAGGLLAAGYGGVRDSVSVATGVGEPGRFLFRGLDAYPKIIKKAGKLVYNEQEYKKRFEKKKHEHSK